MKGYPLVIKFFTSRSNLKISAISALACMALAAAILLVPPPSFAASFQNFQLHPGFNFICLTLVPDRSPAAILSENAALSDIYAFNAAAGTFASVSSGELSSFAAGRGYIVINGSTSQYTLSIEGAPAPEGGTAFLKKGFNLVGFSGTPPAERFSSIVEKNPAVAGIYKWNPVSGSFVQVLKDPSGRALTPDSADPSVKPGESYFFNMSSDSEMSFGPAGIFFGGGMPPRELIFRTVSLGGLVPPLEMAAIPPGSFYMGSPDPEPGRASWEGPQKLVSIISGFYIGRYEITRAQWRAVMGSDPSRFRSSDSLPVETVSWKDCQSFVSLLNESASGRGGVFRLPSEAEWEYACRAGSGSAYYWGASMDGANCLYRENSGGAPGVAGSKKSNAWGLFDMSGNVREWCLDEFVDMPALFLSCSPSLAAGFPGGRICRGGDWDSYPGQCRSAARSVFGEDERLSIAGLRLVMIEKADMPVISPSGGKFSSPQIVKITSDTPLASIYYTIDGSAPSSSNGKLYSGPFTVSSPLTVRAVAVREGVADSFPAAASFDVTPKAATPSFGALPGVYHDAARVAIYCLTYGASIRYTLDGSAPSSSNGYDYTAPVSILSTAELKAVAVKPGFLDSEVVSGRFVILEKAAAPVITPSSGEFSEATAVSVKCETPGAIIIYTRDGSEPTLSNASVCEGSITVFQPVTIKARAIAAGMADSAVTTAKFTFKQAGSPENK